MKNTWFTSDSHFGHTNILTFEKKHRAFESVEEMNEAMINRWNSVVKNEDTIYHLGDFAFGKRNIAIADRLNGKKRLVLGNHDSYPSSDYLKYFEKLYGVTYWHKFILSHAPVHPYNLFDHHRSYGINEPSFINLHGHLHSRNILAYPQENITTVNSIVKDIRYFNVSAEQNNLTPFHVDEIIKIIEDNQNEKV